MVNPTGTHSIHAKFQKKNIIGKVEMLPLVVTGSNLGTSFLCPEFPLIVARPELGPVRAQDRQTVA